MRAPTGTLLRIWLLVGAALVVVAGCSDDPGKASTLPSKTPTTASSSSSPTPNTPEEQIEATMTAYFAAFNQAFETGDVTELKTFSTSGCPCRDSAARIHRTVKSGGHFEGARYNVQSIKVHDIEGGTGLAEVIAIVPPYRILGSDGEVEEDSKGGKLHTDYSLVRSEEGRWIIGNSLDLE